MASTITNPDHQRSERTHRVSGQALRAFSLIEVVVAVGIFAFVIVGVIGLLGPTSKSVAEIVDASVATRLVDNITAELARLRDANPTRLDGLADTVGGGVELVATADGSRVLTKIDATTPPAGVSAIYERDQYFLVTVTKHDDPGDPLRYQTGSGFLALTISVQWPYMIPTGTGNGGQPVDEANRSVALYNIALTP